MLSSSLKSALTPLILDGSKRIGHIRILTVVLETSMKERLMRENLFKCKLFPPHEPPSLARSSPTVRIRIWSIHSCDHVFQKKKKKLYIKIELQIRKISFADPQMTSGPPKKLPPRYVSPLLVPNESSYFPVVICPSPQLA